MIAANQLGKSFDTIWAVQDLNFSLQQGMIWSLVGSNGAGKSTLLRLLCGVYAPSAGSLLMDGKPIYDRPQAKERIFFVADQPFFYRGFSLEQMAAYYAMLYPNWSADYYKELVGVFRLPTKKSIHTFSKGMQRQVALLLGMATRPTWLLLDEAFDGLDPVMRQVLRRLLIQQVSDDGSTVMISSHNLREMEDFSDHAILLHEGKQLFSADLDDLRKEVHKVQVVFPEGQHPSETELSSFMRLERKFGAMETYFAHGKREELEARLRKYSPLVLEIIPLSFEELFLQELGNLHYDVRSLLA